MVDPAPLSVAELNQTETRRLSKDHPEMTAATGRAVVAVAGDAELVESLARAIRGLSHGPTRGIAIVEMIWSLLANDPTNRERYIDTLMAGFGAADRSEVPQLLRNARRRAELVKEFGALTSGEVADLRGSTAGNRAAIASRWKSEGRVFAIAYQKAELYPAFQLDVDGEPRRVVRRVLEAAGRPDGWEIALWFTAANGWLGDERPVDLLDADRDDEIVDAARRSFEPLAV